MLSLQAQQRLASVDAVFFGIYGDVTQLAQQRGVCRQTLYREAHDLARRADGSEHQRQRQQLLDRIQQLQHQADALRQQLDQAVALDADTLAHFAAVAQAEGVSLPQTRRLLAVLRPVRLPSVAQLGRWTQQAARRAAAVLEVLDPISHERIRQAALDELFVGRQPILMAVALESLVWAVGQVSPTRDGAAWAAQLRRLPSLEGVTRDAGTGLDKGIAVRQAERKAQQQKPLEDQDDHFHLLREGTRSLRRWQGRVTRALKAADKADKARAKVARHGQNEAATARKAGQAWRRAEAAFADWSAAVAAWDRIRHEALPLFTPLGQRNTRAQAEAVLATTLPLLSGPAWAKVRRLLKRPGFFTFLDRVEKALGSLAVPSGLVKAAVQVEGSRRRPEARQGDGASASACRGVLMVATVTLSLAQEAGEQALAAVREVLSRAWRASSVVEGLNSVVRMHQGRHRRVTQGLLDLKRLYWNCRSFRTGRRKKQSPYGLLGMPLPTPDWWALLQMSPEELRQRLRIPPKEPEQQLSPQQLVI